ncbi:MAG: hypothetical protein L6R28_25455, partial [Planctomycetes bacterium]|nr:hypothetical protein [Planctomycetota bacterium]
RRRRAGLRFSYLAPENLIYQANWLTLNIGSRSYGLSKYRIYDPELGIFLSRDFLPYLNKYRAWSNNPVGQVDKDGLVNEAEAQSELRVAQEAVEREKFIVGNLEREFERNKNPVNASWLKRQQRSLEAAQQRLIRAESALANALALPLKGVTAPSKKSRCRPGFRSASAKDYLSIAGVTGLLKAKGLSYISGCDLLELCVKDGPGQILGLLDVKITPWKASSFTDRVTRDVVEYYSFGRTAQFEGVYCCSPDKIVFQDLGTASIAEKTYFIHKRQFGSINIATWFFVYSLPAKAEKAAVLGFGYGVGQVGATAGEALLTPFRATGFPGVEGQPWLWEQVHNTMSRAFKDALSSEHSTSSDVSISSEQIIGEGFQR